MRSLSGIEPCTDWLTRKLQGLAMSQAKLARLLGREPAQVHRWLRGREPIPRESLMEIAALDGPGELSYVNGIKNCEEMVARLGRECVRLAEQIQLQPALLIDYLLDRVERHTAFFSLTSSRQDVTTQHLAAAILAVRATRRCFADGQLLVGPENLRHHFQYPTNAYLGDLLDLDQGLHASEAADSLVLAFRDRSLASLRSCAELVRSRSAWDELSRQHAVHMLARHGETADQEYAESFTSAPDIELRRMAYYGLVIGRKDEEVIAQFYRELQRDKSLARVTLAFDAVHYGDATLTKEGHLPDSPVSFDKTIVNILRHLIAEAHPGVRDLAFFKLAEILRWRGRSAFAQASERGLLPELLGQVGRDRSREAVDLAKLLKEVNAPEVS